MLTELWLTAILSLATLLKTVPQCFLGWLTVYNFNLSLKEKPTNVGFCIKRDTPDHLQCYIKTFWDFTAFSVIFLHTYIFYSHSGAFKPFHWLDNILKTGSSWYIYSHTMGLHLQYPMYLKKIHMHNIQLTSCRKLDASKQKLNYSTA